MENFIAFFEIPVIGPFQFIKKIRSAYKTLHRIIGYIYAVSILFSGLAGLIIAPFAMGGWVTTIGFYSMAIRYNKGSIFNKKRRPIES